MQKHCEAGISNWNSDNNRHKQMYTFMYAYSKQNDGGNRNMCAGHQTHFFVVCQYASCMCLCLYLCLHMRVFRHAHEWAYVRLCVTESASII